MITLKKIIVKIQLNLSLEALHDAGVTPEPLSGDLSGSYKFRIGDWRVIYTTETGVIVIQSVQGSTPTVLSQIAV